MSVTPLLELLELNENQSGKAIAVNFALRGLESALSDCLTIPTLSADSDGSIIHIPFDNTNDLSSRSALRAICYFLEAGSIFDFDLVHPSNKHLFLVKNNSDTVATVKTDEGTGIEVLPYTGALLYCDGLNVLDFTEMLSPATQTKFVTDNYTFVAYDFIKPTILIVDSFDSITLTIPAELKGLKHSCQIIRKGVGDVVFSEESPVVLYSSASNKRIDNVFNKVILTPLDHGLSYSLEGNLKA